jgi:hypothetical protein
MGYVLPPYWGREMTEAEHEAWCALMERRMRHRERMVALALVAGILVGLVILWCAR